jgi:hypothetical protein
MSNTLLVGPVGPDRKIPWMKPDDIKVDDKFPQLGEKGSFALPYKNDKGKYGPFLRCDGSVVGILDSIDNDSFRALLTRHGGELIGDYPAVNPSPGGGQGTPVIYIINDGKETVARITMEAPESVPETGPGGASPPNVPPQRPSPPGAPATKKAVEKK